MTHFIGGIRKAYNQKRVGTTNKPNTLIMKKVLQNLFCLLLLTSSIVTAQNSGDKQGMSIDKQLVFVLNDTNINEIKSTYTVDITDLGFKSSEALSKFCASFSWDLHKLTGDFNSKKITVALNKPTLIERKYDVKKLNKHFESVSRRMQYVYQQLNQ